LNTGTWDEDVPQEDVPREDLINEESLQHDLLNQNNAMEEIQGTTDGVDLMEGVECSGTAEGGNTGEK
jgi:hypothetical protein